MWNEIVTWQEQLNLRPDLSAKTIALCTQDARRFFSSALRGRAFFVGMFSSQCRERAPWSYSFCEVPWLVLSIPFVDWRSKGGATVERRHRLAGGCGRSACDRYYQPGS